jgi:hypothetical protein
MKTHVNARSAKIVNVGDWLRQTIIVIKQAMPPSLRRALVALIAAALIAAAGWVAFALVLPQFTPTYKTQFLIDTAGEPDAVRDSLQKVVGNAGDRDALALRSFGGECGADDNTTQLVDFDTGNRTEITDATRALRETGEPTLVRGIVEAVADFDTPFSRDAKQVNRIIVITRHGADACDDDAGFVAKEIRDRVTAAGLAVEIRLIGYQVPTDQRDPLATIAAGSGAPEPMFTETPDELAHTLDWVTNTEPVLRDATSVVDTLNATVEKVNTAVRSTVDGRLDVAEQNLDAARDAVTDNQFEDLEARRKTPSLRDIHDRAAGLRGRQAKVLDAADRLLDAARSGEPLEARLAEFKEVADDYNTEVHTMNEALAALRAEGPGGQS